MFCLSNKATTFCNRFVKIYDIGRFDMFLCPYSNNKFDTLSGLVLSISKKYGFDKKVEFYISYYNLNIEELKKEYFEEEKGLKRISREKKVPYKVLKDVFLYYDINLRSPKEALILQNSKNKKIFLEKYGVENPFQLEEVKKKCNTEEVIEKSILEMAQACIQA